MTLESRLLSRLAPWRDAPAWRVALSGGLDSSVLLHLLVQLSRREALPPLSAIHIHHGLQAAADGWADHCQRLCDELGVPLTMRRVRVAEGASLERAARQARYDAFAAALAPGEVLLLGQHRDDQAETLLFRLLRGAGVQGLAAMPPSRSLAAGHLLRPLLDCPRQALSDYAQAHGLRWVEDPSNADLRFSRNYLRHRLLPLIGERWPAAVETLARAADHQREAALLLDELAQQDLAAAQIPPQTYAWLGLASLTLAPLRRLSPPRQRNAVRHWLRALTPMPDSEHWAGWQALLEAAGDAAPLWPLKRGVLCRADERLWWLCGDWLQVPPAIDLPVVSGQWLALPGNGRARIKGELAAGDWRLGYRQAGASMRLPGRGQRDLKRLLNERRLPAFVRGRLPILLCDGEVRALANLPGLDADDAATWRLIWQPPVCDPGLS
ncbi:tRNA lysidine(34) synthetase TilS [Phytopseudomonas dryadis]|uniref:tRNA(Ile)-lysidine synthase n=1 Tax=Phytopseudomonas dryadis TaxID=2487520 RepID=A0ABY1YZ43_9GAMM|nr:MULTISPECIES: tRNA lysidine(34) synthetase TilS [Pseudomonas]TBU98989.1 tRNA lysidine(34) synthetase TilS [Pseudomonas dryadis]TBV11680.1 tRNA lysidine(34) synthetase TilS [Pseudomonas sp. FRB 230]